MQFICSFLSLSVETGNDAGRAWGFFCDGPLGEVYLPLSFLKGDKQEMTTATSCFRPSFGKTVF